MLNLLGKALTGMVLTRDARDAIRDAGGLASTIQGSADLRVALAAVATPRIGGSTPLTPPSASSSAAKAALMAQALANARAAVAGGNAAPSAPRLTSTPPAGSATLSPTAEAAILAEVLAMARAAASEEKKASKAALHAEIADAPPQARPSGAARPAKAKGAPASSREALIRNAMKVHSAKQTILDGLSDEQRTRLVDLATKLFVAGKSET